MTSQNTLTQQTSPYLLQHKDNPVHWRPWGPDALADAREANKPILLSVGYAACHWCHVMAHESFENPDIAKVMNESFVNIKVDREERPDLDNIYQSALAMMGQQGGWPLTMFLTPNGDPFWGGTYFPPTAKHGLPAFPDVLKSVAEAYRGEPDKVFHNVQALREGLEKQSHPTETLQFEMAMLDNAASELVSFIDPEHGGLRGAPKFPQPSLFVFLWHAYKRRGDEAVREAVTLTLDQMCEGGIYDHLGGGFHRYSTDEAWLVPHFEKMLYDNAQLIELLSLVWQDSRKDLYRQRVAETVEWLLREMLAEADGFAATLDADTQGEEGKFYVWEEGEIDRILGGGEDALWFKHAYDAEGGGNWDGKVILNRNKPTETVGAGFEEKLARGREALFRERELRPRPQRDDKVLADWNGMAIAALARAAFIFERPDWMAAARKAFSGVTHAMSRDGRLGHSLRKGKLQPHAMLDDYAQMARAALALFETTGEHDYLRQAEAWVEVANQHYWDSQGAGYFMSAADAIDVVIRSKNSMDSAVPSGNGVMSEVLARLYFLTGKTAYRDRAEATIAVFSGRLQDHFANMTSLLIGFEMLQTAWQVVVVGDPEDQKTRAFYRVVAESALPNLVLTPVKSGTRLPEGHPAHGKGEIDGKPTVYVCEGMTCRPPVIEVEDLRAILQRS